MKLRIGKNEKAVAKMAATDKSRFGFTAVHVGIWNGKTSLVATDGKGLTIRAVDRVDDHDATMPDPVIPIPVRAEVWKAKGKTALATFEPLTGRQILEDDNGRAELATADPKPFLDFAAVAKDVLEAPVVATIVFTRSILERALESIGETERVHFSFTTPRSTTFNVGDRLSGPIVIRPVDPVTDKPVETTVNMLMPVASANTGAKKRGKK